MLDLEAMCLALALHPVEIRSPSDLLPLVSALFRRKWMQVVHNDIYFACLAINDHTLHGVGA